MQPSGVYVNVPIVWFALTIFIFYNLQIINDFWFWFPDAPRLYNTEQLIGFFPSPSWERRQTWGWSLFVKASLCLSGRSHLIQTCSPYIRAALCRNTWPLYLQSRSPHFFLTVLSKGGRINFPTLLADSFTRSFILCFLSDGHIYYNRSLCFLEAISGGGVGSCWWMLANRSCQTQRSLSFITSFKGRPSENINQAAPLFKKVFSDITAALAWHDVSWWRIQVCSLLMLIHWLQTQIGWNQLWAD